VEFSIHRLHLASVNLRGQYNPPTFLDTRIDVFAYLIKTDTAALLVDTGVGEGNGYIEDTFQPRRASIAEELMRYGVKLTDVSVIVNSHLHFDHCGNNALFPQARFYVQERELEIARTSVYTVREWFDFERARIVPVAGDLEICAGIRLLSSPGHTPGHHSVLVGDEHAGSLVAAQAAFTGDEFLRGGDPVVQAHEGLGGQYLESIARLRAVAAQEVYFSHDPSVVRNGRLD